MVLTISAAVAAIALLIMSIAYCQHVRFERQKWEAGPGSERGTVNMDEHKKK